MIRKDWAALVMKAHFGLPIKTFRHKITEVTLSCDGLYAALTTQDLSDKDLDDLSFLVPVLEGILAQTKIALGFDS